MIFHVFMHFMAQTLLFPRRQKFLNQVILRQNEYLKSDFNLMKIFPL